MKNSVIPGAVMSSFLSDTRDESYEATIWILIG